MAKKRMFSLDIVDTDLFLEMPQSTQNLYFHLGMRADDDGFVSNPKKIIKMIGANEDDLKVLASKQFIIPFESGVIVIRHWRLNNYLQNDRYKETIYKTEKSLLSIDSNNVYNLDTECIHSIDKNRLDKISIDKNRCCIDSNKNNKEGESCVDSPMVSESCVDSLPAPAVDKDFKKISEFYNNNIGLLTPYGASVLEDYQKEMDTDLIILAMQKAVEANKRTIQYIKGILNSWSKSGIKSVIEAKNEEEQYKKNKGKKEETIEEEAERLKKKWGLEDDN